MNKEEDVFLRIVAAMVSAVLFVGMGGALAVWTGHAVAVDVAAAIAGTLVLGTVVMVATGAALCLADALRCWRRGEW